MIPISVVEVGQEEEALVLQVLRSGMLAQGAMVQRFEHLCREMTGAAHAVAVNNGTTALVAALEALQLRPGDEVDISAGELRWTVIVRGLTAQRRPAPEARLLYEETAASAARRTQLEEIRRLAPMPGAGLKGRPTKKAGRLIRGFNE